MPAGWPSWSRRGWKSRSLKASPRAASEAIRIRLTYLKSRADKQTFAEACAFLRSQLERYHFDRGRAEVRVVGHGFYDGAGCCSIPIGGRDHRVVLAVDGRCAADPAF